MVSRQQKYQLHQTEIGKCKECPNVICEQSKIFCTRHLELYREHNKRNAKAFRARKKQAKVKQFIDSLNS